ncbi:MAG TPA: CPBP family intramembrane glutamic endopeptidase [Ktedonobacteraceae bacterium]|nr:CPBP family intramembrane glutamic endopeptidase [Ktedonobacteraceae bacterium]
MDTSSSPQSLLSEPTVKSKQAIGANSRPLRFLIVTLVVAIYIFLGFALHFTGAQYQLLGLPILLLFQVGIHRQPLRTLWVRAGSPLSLDGWFFVLWGLLALFPAYAAVRAAMDLQFANAAEYGLAIVGAFGMAYALRAMRATTWRSLGLCILTVGIIGLLPQFLSLLLPHVLHLHIARQGTTPPPFLQSLTITIQWVLMAPLGFMVEEVFFRGALDTYLHAGEQGTGWLSAVVVSALWGLWHLPGQVIAAGQLLPTVIGLLAAQILVGVPLSLWWRKSGNMVVNDTAHALLDAIRNGLAGVGPF